MDAAERQLLDETVRDAISDAVVSGADAAAVDKVLTDLGWLEMLDAEPRDATAIVFTALGLANAASSALDDVVAAALGVAPRLDLAVVLPDYGAWSPPGRLEDGTLRASGVGTARAVGASEVLVVCANLSAVTVPASAVDATAVHGADPDGGLHRVRVEHAAGAGPDLANDAWDDAVAAGRRAVAHQIAGASRTVLDLARTHALDREQFGRPVA